MTQVAFEQDGFASDAFYILELGTGSAVTGDIVMTPGAGVPDEKFMAAVAYSNVDQTTPTSSAMNREEQNAAGINSTLTVTSEDGDLVFAVFDAFHNTATVTTTLGAGKTVVHSTGSQSIDSGGEGTYTTTTQDGATSVTSNFTTNGEAIIHMAMNINAANFSPTQTVNVSVSPTPSIAENGGNITITATAGGAVSGAQTVDLALSGAATAVDFSGALPTQITIADGATSGSVTAAVFDDALDENNETATFTISNPSSGLTLGATTSASTDINDNDPTPTVSLSLSGSPFDENAGTATVTATLSAVSGLPVTVPLTFGGGAAGPGASDDYTASVTTISIAAGSPSGVTTLTGVDDTDVEGDETVEVSINTGGLVNATVGATTMVTATITDDDFTPPTATVSGDATICSGGSTTISAALTGASPWNITWSDGAVQNGVTASPVMRTVSPTNTTVYTITSLSDVNLAGTSAGSATVTVVSNPSVTVADASTCAGGSATISAGVTSGTAPFSYAWTVPGGATNPGDVSSFSATVAGNYAVIVTDVHGCTGSDNGDLTVNPNPVVTVADASTCAGGSATISAGVTSGTAPFSYAWTVPGGATNPGDVSSFSATVAGNYAVIVTDVHGCTGSDNGDLTVNPNPVVTVADASTCAGGSATISAGVTSGTAPFSYAWTVPGGATNPGDVSSFSASVAGNYAVVVTDVHGCTGSDNGDLTIHPNPTADAGADATILSGASTAIGGGTTASGGTGALTIAWTPTTGLDDATIANPTATPTATTTYTVTVTDVNGCEATDDVTVTVQTNNDVITDACAAVQALIDDPNTPSDALSALQDAKDALNDAANTSDTEDFFDAMRDAANALEDARDEGVDTDPIAATLSTLARHIATQKRAEAFACDPTPTGKMQDDIDDGDSDLADGDLEVATTYHGDGVKDYKKAWEDYCSALDRCQNPKAAVLSDESLVNSIQTLPNAFALHQNYPNPFNPSTTIQFDLVDAGYVSLSIYNSAGQLVRTLVSGDYAPGAHKVVWDARDDSGQRVASGLYMYTIRIGQQFTAQKKLLLMK